jgi:hypothetical protein
MINKISVLILLLNIGIFSQQAVLFKSPPSDMTLPLILTEEGGIPKTSGLGAIETKWTQSATANIDELLRSFSVSADIGIKKMIHEILVNANIPESKINQVKINFTSSGIEERVIDKEAVMFSEDFASRYTGENYLLITKLYRTKNAVIELTEGSAAQFDQDVKNALSEGLRFGNKTETVQDNKMIIEIQYLVFAYEYIPIIINRTTDKNLVLPLYLTTDVGLNSITNISISEGAEYDYFVRVVSSAVPQPVEFRISNVNPKTNFRTGGREAYTLKYVETNGNKVTFTISGFVISFP